MTVADRGRRQRASWNASGVGPVVVVRRCHGGIATYVTKAHNAELSDPSAAPLSRGAVLTSLGNRTDIRGGMLFRYDGTRWLSEQLFLLTFYPSQGVATDQFQSSYPLPSDHDVWIEAVQFMAFGDPAGGTWVHYLQAAWFDESSYPVLASFGLKV